jgi:hypothetical protein
MRAQPGAGYSFGGWTGACTGRAEICAVTASAAATVGANFVPQRRGRAVSIQLRKPRIKATFTQSAGTGTLTVNGSITATARLRFQLRRPGGGPLLSRSRSVASGPFGFRASLKRGKLLRGASLFPGGFVLSVTGRSGRVGVPLQMRTVVVKAPSEGVVRRTYASTSPGGPATATLPAGTKEAWAIFKFASQPTAEPLTVTWFQPNGTVVGSKQKNNRPTIQTGIGNAAGIPSGTWRVELSAGGKLVKRFNIRIG